jgi:hypothetical protein
MFVWETLVGWWLYEGFFFSRFHRYGIEGWEWVEETRLVDKGRRHSKACIVDHILHGGGTEVLVRCGEKLWRNFDYLTIKIWWCPRHCVCGWDFSIKDPVAEEVVVCAHTEDLFGGRNSYQGVAVFTGTLVDNATGGKISKGDRCGEVQWLESGGSEQFMLLTKCFVGTPISVPELPTMKNYPPKFSATLVFKTMTARRSPLQFRTVGGQDNHVHGALLIGSGVVRE